MRNVIFNFAIVVSEFVAFILFLFVPIATIDYYGCKSKVEKMNMHGSWGAIQGCMVEHTPGKWIPIDNYRVVEK